MPRSLEVQIIKAARRIVALIDKPERDMDDVCDVMNGDTKYWARENGPLDEAMARYIVGKSDNPKAV